MVDVACAIPASLSSHAAASAEYEDRYQQNSAARHQEQLATTAAARRSPPCPPGRPAQLRHGLDRAAQRRVLRLRLRDRLPQVAYESDGDDDGGSAFDDASSVSDDADDEDLDDEAHDEEEAVEDAAAEAVAEEDAFAEEQEQEGAAPASAREQQVEQFLLGDDEPTPCFLDGHAVYSSDGGTHLGTFRCNNHGTRNTSTAVGRARLETILDIGDHRDVSRMKVHLAVWADEEQDLHLRVVVCDRCFGLLYPHRRDVDAQVSLEDDDSIRVRTAAGTSPPQIALADQARTKTLKLPQRIVWRQRSSTNGGTASSRRRAPGV